MEISWYGLSCFKLQERNKASIVTDPYDESIGLPLPSLKGDVVTVSHEAPGHSAVWNVKKAEYVLNRPGEYEIGGVFITGVGTYDPEAPLERVRHNIIFVFSFNGVTVAHLGDLAHVPGQAEIEKLGPIDVLLVPVGGGGALSSTQASEVISLIEPAIVVPMHYQIAETTLDLEPVDRFLAEMGVQEWQEQDTLRLSSVAEGEDTQIVVLRPLI